jgi:hypothetical protein
MKSDSQQAASDGQRDFDFLFDIWNIHLKTLLHPLTGSTTWVEFEGTSVARKVWSGRANVNEFEADRPTGHIEGLTLRLYDPKTHHWSLYWATTKGGRPDVPTVGEFKNRRGEFFDTEASGQPRIAPDVANERSSQGVAIDRHSCRLRTRRLYLEIRKQSRLARNCPASGWK